MSNLLILIDNEQKALEIMKGLITSSNFKDITTQILCKKPDESVDSIVDRIKEQIPTNEEEQTKLNFHIVIDTCLTDEEHEKKVIDENFTGIQCLFKISKMLINTKCQYNLSLMSRFFANQLQTLERLNDFKADKKNNFYAIIRKPFLDSGEVDKGFSLMPQYVSVLPERFLSQSYIKSFINILIYAFLKEK